MPAGDSTPSVLPLIAVEADDGNGIGESGCVERGWENSAEVLSGEPRLDEVALEVELDELTRGGAIVEANATEDEMRWAAVGGGEE